MRTRRCWRSRTRSSAAMTTTASPPSSTACWVADTTVRWQHRPRPQEAPMSDETTTDQTGAGAIPPTIIITGRLPELAAELVHELLMFVHDVRLGTNPSALAD